MVVPVELRRGDLQTTANHEIESLRQWKSAEHESRRQEHFFLSVQRTARPKRRIFLDHRPDFSLDLVLKGGIENDRRAQEIRAAGWKVRANCALKVPRPEALPDCKSGRQNSVAHAIRRRSRGERTAEKQSHKVVALALRCGKRPKLHLPREVSKAIRGLRLMYKIAWWKYSHFQPCCRDDFQTS